MNQIIKVCRAGVLILLSLAFDLSEASAAPVNLALNPSRVGVPTPLLSDHGWGGGSDPWEIVDGKRSYDIWAHGLAFTGGVNGWAGEPGGVRQATIDFGTPTSFNDVTIWWHGILDTPMTTALSYFDVALGQWRDIGGATRLYGAMHEDGANSGYSDSDEYFFNEVVGSAVRLSFNNLGLAINGGQMVHGWIYSFEVYNQPGGAIPEPGSLVLVLAGLGIVCLGAMGKSSAPARAR